MTQINIHTDPYKQLRDLVSKINHYERLISMRKEILATSPEMSSESEKARFEREIARYKGLKDEVEAEYRALKQRT